MANISAYLAAIMAAVYGQDVRSSIHDAIEIINEVSEVILTTGTAVTGPTSSSTGFFTDSLYLNTNTMELWKCIGTNSWASMGTLKGADGRGISSITLTSSSGLVDTYTITYDDGSAPDTFTVTNGAPGTNGADGSKWYKGTALTGTGTGITGFPGNINDFYLNSTDGYVYTCMASGDATTATWDYVMTLTGGGGSSITVVDNLNSTSGTDALSANQGRVLNTSKINDPTTKSSGQVLTWNGSAWEAQTPTTGSTTLSGLTDVQLSSPSDGQILEYDGSASKWKNAENIKDFARYAGSKTFSQLASSLLVAANVDKFYLCTDGGTISSADAANWILPAGSVIPPDSHIAVIETSPGVYQFDDFGGYVDISGKADKTELDGWTSPQTESSGQVTFTGLDDTQGWGYYPWFYVDGATTNKNPSATINTITGAGTSNMTVVYDVVCDAGSTVYLRIEK